jgi:hypothetical protein
MTTQAFSSAGSTISISAGVPATYNAAGFAALTYTPIKEVTDIGALGKSVAMVTHVPVDSAVTYKVKTIANSGQLALKGARVATDPGQTILLAAVDSFAPYAVKIVLQNGTIMYAQALVLDYVTTVGNAGVITSFDSKIELSGDIVVV